MYLCCALRGCRKNFALCFWDFLENHNPVFFGGSNGLDHFFGHYGFERLEPLV